MMKFDELPEFKKDIKSLVKRFKSLHDDLDIVKKVLEVKSYERSPFSFRIDILGLETCVFKVRKMACKSHKSKGVYSGLRLIYAYFEEEEKIVLIEIFYKGDKENEDRRRILNNFI